MSYINYGNFDDCAYCRKRVLWGRTAKNNKPICVEPDYEKGWLLPKQSSLEHIDPNDAPRKLLLWAKGRLHLRDVYRFEMMAWDKDGQELQPQQVAAWMAHFTNCKEYQQMLEQKRIEKERKR